MATDDIQLVLYCICKLVLPASKLEIVMKRKSETYIHAAVTNSPATAVPLTSCMYLLSCVLMSTYIHLRICYSRTSHFMMQLTRWSI